MLKKTFWFLGVILALIIIFLPGYTKLQELRDRNCKTETKIKQLHRDNLLLEQQINRIESDAIYQENIARDKMGIVRHGEIPIKIIPSNRQD